MQRRGVGMAAAKNLKAKEAKASEMG